MPEEAGRCRRAPEAAGPEPGLISPAGDAEPGPSGRAAVSLTAPEAPWLIPPEVARALDAPGASVRLDDRGGLWIIEHQLSDETTVVRTMPAQGVQGIATGPD